MSDQQPVTQKIAPLKMPDLAETFLRSKDFSAETRRNYALALRHLVQFLERSRITRPIPEDLFRFRDEYLSALKLTPRSCNLYIYAVKSFFAFLDARGLYPDLAHFMKGFARPVVHLRGWLSDTQIRQVLDGVERKTLLDFRNYALINLLARTGLHTIELTRADLGDVQTRDDVRVLMVQGKGRRDKDAWVVLTDKAWGPLEEYHKRRGHLLAESPLLAAHARRNPQGRMTTRSVRRICRALFQKAGLDVRILSAHSLRHSTATIALLKGAKVEQVQGMLRHKSVETTMMYVRDIERIKNPAEKFVDF